MKYLVLSDSHGSFQKVFDVITAHSEIDNIIFLGDGARDIEDAMLCFEKKKFYCVSGNCDIMCDFSDNGVINDCEVKILYTHGSDYGVKSSLLSLRAKANMENADLVLYGHTHIAKTDEHEGKIFLNPGSLKNGSYAIVEINNGQIKTSIESISNSI